ncbi:MAG: hypothetical protein E7346_07790 [Clostridiales bacterium]|nr:hypothetical protein [Clostridiales bacterium]
MSKKLGLVLGAGGSRGVAHIGFIRALEETGIKPDYITGSSMGSVVGGCYAVGLTPDQMEKEVGELKLSELLDISMNPFGNAALLRSKKMRTKLKKYLKNYTFNQTKIPFRCVAVDILTGKTKVFLGDELLLDGVSASSSIPGIFKPVQIGDMSLVDGGVNTRLPIEEVREMGADVVVAVDVLGDIRPTVKKHHIVSLMMRVGEIYDAELTKYKVMAQKPDLYLTPDLGDMSQYKLSGIDNAIKSGYELGKEYAKKIKQLLK